MSVQPPAQLMTLLIRNITTREPIKYVSKTPVNWVLIEESPTGFYRATMLTFTFGPYPEVELKESAAPPAVGYML